MMILDYEGFILIYLKNIRGGGIERERQGFSHHTDILMLIELWNGSWENRL